MSGATKLYAGVIPRCVEAYLHQHGHPNAKLLGLRALGAGTQEGLKVHGYGRPLIATFTENGRRREVVFRTMRADHFGHDRRADRIDALALSFDNFERFPRHVRAIDFGVIRPDGRLVSIAEGEPFLVTEYVPGELYAADLTRMAKRAVGSPRDVERARALAEYLAQLHAERVDPELRRRAIRDLVGHGEGIFGLIDSYRADDPVVTPTRLAVLERRVVDWRRRLRDADEDRARRTHGDFHPFNILFREGSDFSVLDASRGGAGDPADDVACLTINYLFFALSANGRFDGALREAWDVFWRTYLERTRDEGLLDLIAPFYAWRALVLASPIWYPDVAPEIRDRILSFAERLLDDHDLAPLDPLVCDG